MGTLFYGNDRIPIRIDDRVLAHLRALVTSKMRRGEGFLLSWTDSITIGDGRSSIWMHAGCDVHYKFDDERQPKLDPALLEQLNQDAVQARGIEIAEATLAHRPEAG
jgi:hypothetical protein